MNKSVDDTSFAFINRLKKHLDQ